MMMTEKPDQLVDVIENQIESNGYHTFYQSVKFSGRFYILSYWTDSENFRNFMKESLHQTFVNPILQYLNTDPFFNRFELEEIFNLHGKQSSPYYKLSKSTVKDIEYFKSQYSKKYTVESFKNEAAESIRVFSDYRLHETITFLSGWNSLEEIYEWQKSNPPNALIGNNSTGTVFSPDEYDVLKSL